MNILVLGSGGREHALSWKIAQSPNCDHLYIAPGNAGTASVGQNIDLKVTDFEGIAAFVKQENIDLVVVGPEDPLVKGIRDFFQADESLKNVLMVGPGAAGAQLEGSKDFSKQFMEKHGIPTARSRTFTIDSLEEGLNYVSSHPTPVVLKADGLAAGKGVIISETHEHARETLKEMLVDAKFGDASSRVVVEQFLAGIEVSVFVLTDGKNYKVLPEAKDYKRIGENDTGLNTGGMGAVTPVPFADEAFMSKVRDRIIQPTIDGLNAEGIDYKGFIFIGLMNMEGDPYVIEYNVRMGDPETQVVMPSIKSDVLDLFTATANGTLDKVDYELDGQACTTVVMVSGGYPGSYAKGEVISGIDNVEDAIVFHAGTKTGENGEVLTNGGRVLALTSYGADFREALAKSNRNAERVYFEGRYYRKDIGFDL